VSKWNGKKRKQGDQKKQVCEERRKKQKKGRDKAFHLSTSPTISNETSWPDNIIVCTILSEHH